MLTIVCPCCQVKLDLLDLIERHYGREALRLCGEFPADLFGPAMSYLSLFRSPGKQLRESKFCELFAEIADGVEAACIEWRKRRYVAPRNAWKAAFSEIQNKQEVGALKTPLKSHGLLYAIIAANAEKTEAVQEREREEQKRRAVGRPTAPVTNGLQQIDTITRANRREILENFRKNITLGR